MSIAPSVLNFLSDRDIPFERIAHPKSHNSGETAVAAHIPDDHIAKGVLLRDDDGYLLAVIPASEWLALGRLQTELGRELELATEPEIVRLFSDCDPGAIPPLGMAYGLEMVLDEALTSLAKVYLEGGDHKELIVLHSEQFLDLMKGVRHGHFCQVE